MPRPVLVRAQLTKDTAVERDAAYNDWVVEVPGDDPLDAVAALPAFKFFYGSVEVFSATLNGGMVFSLYDLSTHLDGSDHGSPFAIDEDPAVFAPSSSAPYPDEVSIVLTLYGQGRGTAPVEVAGQRPKQRRTGHIYLGPVGSAAGAVISSELLVATAVRDNLASITEDLRDELATVGAPLQVWSRASVATYPVVGGHVDNGLDTVRSRGPQAKARSVWGALT